MKILAAKFVLEANANVPMLCDLENVALSYGTGCSYAYAAWKCI